MMALAFGADAGEHFSCRSGRVLRFIQDDKGIVEGSAAHVGQRRDLDSARGHVITQFVSRIISSRRRKSGRR